MPSVRGVVLVVVTALVTVVVPGAQATPPADPVPKHCAGPLACGEDLDAALGLEARMADHLWYGLALPIEYRTAERLPGDVASIGPGWGDAGLWSGTYLAAESYRYALAREKAKSHTQQGFWKEHFWKEQQDQSKERIDSLLAQMDVRTHIARSWQTTLSPSVGTTVPPTAGFGGGLIPGESGMLMYSCAPADAPAGRDMHRNSDVRGPWRWDGVAGRPDRLALPKGDYVCEASTTRDTYAGVLFGMLTAFDLVGPDDAAARDLIRDDILAMADFLLKYGWNYAHPHGEVAVPPFGDVYDNAVTPIMVISPTYRLGVSQAALHVAELAGPTEQALKWRAVWTEELATQSPSDIVAAEANDPTPTAGYYGWNLSHLMSSSLVRLAENPQVRAVLRTDFSPIDRQTSDDVNAFFEAVTFGMGGEPARRDAAVTHLRQWREYRAKLDAGTTVNNTAGCGTVRTCVPEDEYDVIVDTAAGEQRTTVPGSATRLRSVEPIPVADRAPTDFLWQRSPFTEMTGTASASHAEPGIDYLLPYWMLRYLTEVDVPALDPLPTWPGPRYSGT